MFKLIRVFTLLFLLIFMTALSLYSQYTPVKVSICTAEVSIGGSAVTNMSVSIRNRYTDALEAKIQWTNVIWGQTVWKIANQYADIDFSCSQNKWYLVLTTDNTNPAIANPTFKGGGDNAAGLVNTLNSNQTLDMVWQIRNDTSGTPAITLPIDQGGGQYAFTNNGWAWKWIFDQGQTSFYDTTSNTNTANGPTISTLPVAFGGIPICKGMNQGVTAPNGANDGRLWGAGSWERGDSINSGHRYVYWAADFAGADMTSYKTTAIKLELVIE